MRMFQKQIPNIGLVAYKERLVLGNVRLHCTGKKSEIKTLGVVVDDQLLWKIMSTLQLPRFQKESVC